MPYFCFQLYYGTSINVRKGETRLEMSVLRTAVIRYLSVAELKKGLTLRVAYVVLQQADLLLTRFAISSGFEELNPVMRGLFETPAQLLLFKLIIPVIIAALVPAKLLLPALVLLLMIIGWNLKELIVLIM
jgi:hypothetical protein